MQSCAEHKLRIFYANGNDTVSAVVASIDTSKIHGIHAEAYWYSRRYAD